MEELMNNLQAVKNTLETLTIPATYDNMSRMLGCLQMLTQIKEKLEGNNADNHAE